MDTPLTPILLRVPDAARLMSCGRSTVYRLMDSGKVATAQVGADRRITRESITDYIAKNATSVCTGKGE